MNGRNIVILGFMLFALFFGAGNLIFPPVVGMESGNTFTIAMIGFILTAVLLPFLAVIATSLSKNGLMEIGERVHPVFGLVFAIAIYLSIGPFYAIPRAASVAYELGFVQLTATDHRFTLLLFSLGFFTLTYMLSIDMKKMIDHIGKLLTPALFIILSILFIRAFMTFSYESKPVSEKFQSSPFFTGFLEGYYTLDALGALAFGIVVIQGLQRFGVTKNNDLIKGTIYAGMIASIGLTVVYLSLSWIGRVIPVENTLSNGADILILATNELFGFGGSILFGLIVLLACLTTAVGLTNACASFFHRIFPKLSYEKYILLFVFIGLLITNLGLQTILAVATPILLFIYPFAIVLILLAILSHFIGVSKKMYQYAIIVTSIFAVLSTLDFFNVSIKSIDQLFQFIPFYTDGLGWIIPVTIASIIGFVIDAYNRKIVVH